MVDPQATTPAKIEVEGLGIRFGQRRILSGVDLRLPAHRISAIIGPAHSGKSAFLRALNRMDPLTPGMRVSGRIRFDGRDIHSIRNLYALRRRIGVVAPLPVGLPLSVYDNVAFAPRLAGIHDRARLDAIVESCLRRAALWDEVKDRLQMLGTRLSGGQQQRLTLARALAQEPEVLILDEFAIAIDPLTIMRIEDVLKELREEMTIIMATSLVQQARRLADQVAFFADGGCLEAGSAEALFEGEARHPRTRDYLAGRFG